MARYSDTLRDEITKAPIAGALVTVTDFAGKEATITNDAGFEIYQPIVTGSDGGIVFNATPAPYNIVYSYGGRIIRVDYGVPVGDIIIAVQPSPANAGKYIALDAAGNPYYANGTGPDAGLRTDLAATTGGQLIGYSGRTLSQKLTDIRTVKDFGAKGDNATDDTASVQAAFNAGVFAFPPGDFKVTGNITVPETAVGFVRGAGSGATRIVFASGGLVMPCKGTPNGSYHVKGVIGLSLVTGTSGTDTALKIYRTDTASIDTKILIDDVIMVGSDGIYGPPGNPGPTYFWGTGLDLNQVRFVSCRALIIHGGAPGKSAYGIRIRTTNTDAQFGFFAEGFEIDGFTTGVDVSGWIEGIYWTNFEIFGCRDAFVGKHTGTTVGTWKFQNGHMNGSRNTFQTDNVCAIGLGHMSLARGFIEPGYNAAYQDTGAIGNGVDGFHYPGQVVTIKNATTDGQIQLSASSSFSAFTDTPNHIELQNCTRFTVSDIVCYGPAVTAGLRLSGTTSKGGWNNLVVDKLAGSIAAAVAIDGTCSDITDGSLVSNATTRVSDNGDVLGKYRAGFCAYASAMLVDKTGDGTFYTPILNTTAFNLGSGFNTATGTFTAPIDGLYMFNFSAKLSGLLAAHTDASVLLVTPAGNRTEQFNPFAESNTSTLSRGVSATVKLNAGQTVSPLVVVSGGTKVVDLISGIDGTAFDGYLIRPL